MTIMFLILGLNIGSCPYFHSEWCFSNPSAQNCSQRVTMDPLSVINTLLARFDIVDVCSVKRSVTWKHKALRYNTGRLNQDGKDRVWSHRCWLKGIRRIMIPLKYIWILLGNRTEGILEEICHLCAVETRGACRSKRRKRAHIESCIWS